MSISTQHVLQRFMANASKWGQSQEEAAQEFDRWLAGVKAEAWDEGRLAEIERYMFEPTPNPYRGAGE